jgi:membrane fusion protein (multidrug efflux system)
MKKRPVLLYSIVGAAIVIVLAVIFGLHVVKSVMIKKYFAHMQLPVATVSMAPAREVKWASYIEAIGSLNAVNGVNLSSALPGTVTKIAFHSGDKVKQGQLILQLDISQEQALLQQYQAQEKLNKNNFDRALSLRKKNLNSKQNLDNARTQYAMSQAQVAQEQAVIAKKTIRAPFSGMLGIRQVNLGQYLQPGAAIVNLEQLSPLHLNFTLPQSDAPRIRVGQRVEVQVSAFPGQEFLGKINAIDPAVNAQSRALQVQATLNNPGTRLKPGMYTDIRVVANQAEPHTVVPVTAITYSLYGNSVYVLQPGKRPAQTKPGATTAQPAGTHAAAKGASTPRKTIYIARQVYVKTGESRGNWIVVTGITPGTLVVTAGQIKLHNDSRVVINNQGNPIKIPQGLTP